MEQHIPHVSFVEVATAIRRARLPSCDFVLGIGRGGTVAAALIAYELGVPLHMDWYNYRDVHNRPAREAPRLLGSSPLPPDARHVLLVDDVAVSGSTLRAAAKRLQGFEVTTVVLKGRADIVLLPHLTTCVRWPWHHYCDLENP